MKAIVYTEYGSPDVLQLKEVATPTPNANEILIRVHAHSINYGDLAARNFRSISPDKFNMPLIFWILARLSFGVSRPKITTLGNEFAGEVTAVGTAVEHFKPGDQVFGYRGPAMGANAEFVCMPESGTVTHKPANMSYAEAAVVPYGALTALNLLRHVEIKPGQKVLINGASGGIGSAAVQLAKHFGAEVTGVCGTPRIAFVKALGADHVIDYTREDFTTGDVRYDLILDILGKSSFTQCRNVLTPQGYYLRASFKMRELFQMLWTARGKGQKVVCALSQETPADLVFIRELIEAGSFKSIVDRRYPLEQTAEAHRYIETGNRQGQVVICPA